MLLKFIPKFTEKLQRLSIPA